MHLFIYSCFVIKAVKKNVLGIFYYSLFVLIDNKNERKKWVTYVLSFFCFTEKKLKEKFDINDITFRGCKFNRLCFRKIVLNHLLTFIMLTLKMKINSSTNF